MNDETWRPEKLSHSMASLYEQCPRKWHWQYVKGIRVGSGIAALVGNFAHTILEYLYQEDPDGRTIDKAKEIAREHWPEMESNEHFIRHELTEEEVMQFKRDSFRNIHGLMQMEDPKSIEVIATEQKLDVVIDGVRFGGLVDRIDQEDGVVRIVDYKTGKPGAKRYHADKARQLLLYAAMVRESLDLKPGRISLLFPSYLEEIERKATPSALSRTVNKYAKTWGNIQDSFKNDVWPPEPGPLCGWCDFVAECPEGAQKVKELVLDYDKIPHAPAIEILGIKRR